MCKIAKHKYFLFALLFSFHLNFFCQSTFTCNNVDFEQTSPGTYTSANAVAGWTVSSQSPTSCITSSVWAPGSPEFSVVATPIFGFPYLGNIMHSPLGGTVVARLNNNNANSNITKISKINHSHDHNQSKTQLKVNMTKYQDYSHSSLKNTF